MTTTTIRKLVVTSLVTGIVQADGLLESLPLPLWAVQFVRAGIVLAFIGSVSALAYEVGAFAWTHATKPKVPNPSPHAQVPESESTAEATIKILVGRIAKLEADRTELRGTTETAEVSQPAPTTDSPAPTPRQASMPSTPKARGQRLQPGSTSLADALAEVAR